ncbi:MAG: adenylyltransferase/cytidyltransferase family protein [Deltaproteobacteria bacterium]|nr:adenylyltransferase/cytidyltransferase family protein [Deltaproteobacteria bacterium]MBW2696131.1 adenylyltransferase/cytidyltransferase family protein [Deltaproteobacteria bacterium]
MGRARIKILTRAIAVKKIRGAQRRGEKVVFTHGCFDLLHVGHIRSLEQARSYGDRLIVAINSDASVRELKGLGRPVVPLRQRLEMVAALECVDWVMLFRDATPLLTLRALRPDVLAKGGDWRLDEIIGPDQVGEWGGKIVRLREVPGVRTSALIERIIKAS